MEQPKWDDDAAAWRRFAGGLRERMGEAYRHASEGDARAANAEARASAAEARAAEAETRASAAEAQHRRTLRNARVSRRQLNQIEMLLAEGDVPAAIRLLADRRAWMEVHGRTRRPRA
ncbi:hypothetical protein [Microbacterium sp. HJ5]